MVYIRPPSIPFPSIWHRFFVTRDGTTTRLRVQDLTPDLRSKAVELLQTHFTRDEPPCKYIGINNHPTALAELTKLWTKTVEENLSVVCLEDRDDASEIVGVNVLTVACEEDKDETFETEDKIWAKLFGAVDTVTRGVDIFQRFGVDKYLTAYGLVVAPQWRGLHIGAEILRARIPLCKALSIKVTATVFTAVASQKVAAKAGFETVFKMSYEDLASRGYRFPGVQEHTTSSKMMALVVE